MPDYPSLTALDTLLDALPDLGDARRRQLGMVRRELAAALARDALPVAARRNVRRLLETGTLTTYLRLAESGTLRHRLVGGRRPPTSRPTNQARYDCLNLARKAAGLPRLPLGGGAPILRPTPELGRLAALRRQLDQDLAGHLSPGRIRLTAVLALLLDTRSRSGELTVQRVTHLTDDHAGIHVQRQPQHGTNTVPDSEWLPLSDLSRAALDRWLPLRADLMSHAHGTTRLWVSLRMNHTGTLDDEGRATLRPAGMPLEENGLITSYRAGRSRYEDLRRLLPPKMEQLRRAAEDRYAASRT
ncbi:hypothetical protein [Streptomyces sp. H39-S7]|uniref:hypothetical protein n=1 Tax=Streptomyces sp. H39-S7 TaxID=3004357 RepID=UPI0022AEAD37|nr:hypothetical protein [Streptomyces sp. H39-S7]MCZ4123043.1 hypothetical protein [Streptomyces sp. H39-S7]